MTTPLPQTLMRMAGLCVALMTLSGPVCAATESTPAWSPPSPPGQSLPQGGAISPVQGENQGHSTAIVRDDPNLLPEPARKLREDIIAAAKSGNVEALGPIFARQKQVPQLTFDEVKDPVAFLRDTSNDGEGRETLAIIEELLDAPYAVYNEGSENEVFVWPYFVATDLELLTPEQLVELYRIVSHQDLEEMQAFGGWFFYRISISAKGEWLAFVAGD
jgi:hypothetical protein